MTKKISLLLILIFSLFLYGCDYKNNLKISKVCISDNCFDVKVADEPAQREKGLMNINNMSNSSGMLFIFEKSGLYSFWMKNTLISLDIIWIDEYGKIVYIKHNAIPCKTMHCEIFDPGVEAKYVLEINGGLCQKLGIYVGNNLKIKF